MASEPKAPNEETPRRQTPVTQRRKNKNKNKNKNKKESVVSAKEARPPAEDRDPYTYPPDWGKPLTPSQVEKALFGKVTALLGGQKVLRRELVTHLDAHEMLLRGLPVQSMQVFVSRLGIIGQTAPSLAKALGVSLRTVQRQNKSPEKRLSQEQSGRMWKFAEILAKATGVFGSQRDAEEWMERPATGLEQRRPIDLLETPAGAELVENFLERLEYGVYT